MGGSGGFLGNINPEDYMKKIREAEEKSTSAEFNAEINKFINDLLVKINNRPIDEIKRHLDVITKALSSEIDSSLNLIFGGSVAKHTYVDGLSDIDSLAIINNTHLGNKSPNEVLNYFYNKLIQRLPNTEISKGKLAVTVKYSDKIEIQILPALKTQTGIKIAKFDGDKWSNIIRPKKFAEKLSEINSINRQKLVPVIKLAKSIISTLPDKRKTTGYHTESLAIEVFKNYNGTKTSKDMLKHFFDQASKVVLKPIVDRTNQSIHVDDYLGNRNSIQRQIVSDSFAQICRKMKNADAIEQISTWKSFFK
ncbi:CBASS oligonucleotide cyclase [Labilibaculum euxinus]